MALKEKHAKFAFCSTLIFEQFALMKDFGNFIPLLCAKHSGRKKMNLS